MKEELNEKDTDSTPKTHKLGDNKKGLMEKYST
jgi:hypothetical protein